MGWPDISYLVKLAALVVLVVAVVGSLALVGILTLQQQPIPPYILALAGGGVLQSATTLGLHIAKNGKNGNGNGYASSNAPGASTSGK